MTTAQPQTIVEFRAGKMDWDGKMVTPDKRKGKLQLIKDAEGLHHVLWWDREKNEKIDDYVVVEDAYLQKVNKCTTGRVYILKYTSSSVRVFFWMQEPKDDKDVDMIKRFNDAIGADIPAPPPAAAASAIAGSGSAASSSAAAAGGNAALQAQLLALLQNANLQGLPSRGPRVSLSNILKPDVLLTLAEDAEALRELKTHMPSSQQEDQDVVDTLHSPQLKENMKVLSEAIYSDQLPTLMTMMGLPGGGNGSEDPMEVLAKALEQKHKP
ncbi:unnamed protein product [Amoebophrya sp. A25]|nr:unnamed protein product [Amoebophrya sp. A25]|eukprot:GSA25T00000049001.1